ncbi:MAG: hypothetical protein Q8P41_27290 [Pseudomonadota bacterium]|nr:hypothetical protein [Pseudomonadota bacterium]
MPSLRFLLSLLAATCALGACAVAEDDTRQPSLGADDTAEVETAAPAECEEPLARLDACQLAAEDSLYAAFFTERCYDACVADCLAAAPCEELNRLDVTYTDDEDCPEVVGATGACVADCDSCITPLVLSFDATPIHFSSGPGRFDFGTGRPLATDWPSLATPWLALDRNGNGVVDDATELFGDATPLADGGRGKNGFVPLRALDTDGDGAVTPEDTAWGGLRAWTDLDLDHACSAEELVPLARFGVVAIGVDHVIAPRCDARGNCERERGALRYVTPEGIERQGAVVDVYLHEHAASLAGR